MPREAEPRLNKGKDNRRTQTFKIQELLSRGGQPDPAEPSLSILRTRPTKLGAKLRVRPP